MFPSLTFPLLLAVKTNLKPCLVAPFVYIVYTTSRLLSSGEILKDRMYPFPMALQKNM